MQAPAGLLSRLVEMASSIGAQDWKALATVYDPAFEGRGAAARPLAAHEEIARLRATVARPGFTRVACQLRPLRALTGRDGACLEVEERVVLTWPDQCAEVAQRRLEQRWRFRDGIWLLSASRSVPEQERRYRLAALLPEVSGALGAARVVLDGNDARPSALERACIRATAAELSLFMPGPRLGVRLEASVLPAHTQEALRRACVASIRAWNHTLPAGVAFHRHSGPGLPDILIRPWDGPLPGGHLGRTLFVIASRGVAARASLAEVHVATAERASDSALPLSPPELYYILCHELGHCLGLGECDHRGGVMRPLYWTTVPPAGPFLPERRAVVDWLADAHRLLQVAYGRLGDAGRAAAAGERALLLAGQADEEPSGLEAPGHGLLADTSYAPPLVRHYWEGSTSLRGGRRERAMASFSQALAGDARPAEVLLRRSAVQPELERRLADIQGAVEADGGWLVAREMLVSVLEGCGRESAVEPHRATAGHLAAMAKFHDHLFVARVARSPLAACIELASALWSLRGALSIRLRVRR